MDAYLKGPTDRPRFLDFFQFGTNPFLVRRSLLICSQLGSRQNRGLVSLQWFSLCSIVLLIIVVSLLAIPFLELFSIIWNLYPFYEPIKTPKTLILVFLFQKSFFFFSNYLLCNKKIFSELKKTQKYKYDLKNCILICWVIGGTTLD